MAINIQRMELWRLIALEFGVPGGDRMVQDDSIPMRKMIVRGPVAMAVDGTGVIWKPFERYSCVLQFRPKGLDDPGEVRGDTAIHYEWVVRSSERMLDVALHFQYPDVGTNQDWLDRVPKPPPFLFEGREIESEPERFKRWTGWRYRLRYAGNGPSDDMAGPAARAMEQLIFHTISRIV